MNSLMC